MYRLWQRGTTEDTRKSIEKFISVGLLNEETRPHIASTAAFEPGESVLCAAMA